MNHQRFREAWLFPSLIYLPTRDPSMCSLSPKTPIDSWQSVMLLSAANVPTAEIPTKETRFVEALDRAGPMRSNNGALFQICCLSHRLPLTRQCRRCSAWIQLYPTSYATGWEVVRSTCAAVCEALVSLVTVLWLTGVRFKARHWRVRSMCVVHPLGGK